MSLSSIISKETAEHFSDVTADDLSAIVKALSLGYKPETLSAAIDSLNRGQDPVLPPATGAPRPITINAWSFVKDHGQYHDTYGLSSAKAGELQDMLRTDADKAIAEINKIVTDALRQKGSTRPVFVSRTGMPGTSPAGESTPSGGLNRQELKDRIRRNPTVFGMYRFAAEDTGRDGPHKFRVKLGGGLYSVFSNKDGAIDIARICRVHGRHDEQISGYVAFWLEGKPPLFGSDIPERVTFDGRLTPDEELPADPAARAKTETTTEKTLPQRTPPLV